MIISESNKWWGAIKRYLGRVVSRVPGSLVNNEVVILGMKEDGKCVYKYMVKFGLRQLRVSVNYSINCEYPRSY